MAYKIFISYSRTDQDFTQQLADALERGGFEVWIDVEDIQGGTKWSSAIQSGLDSSDAMLLVISPEAMESLNVEDEWQYIMDRGKPIIPILWRPANVHFQLNRLQYIDFHNQTFDKAMTQLIPEIIRKIENPDVAFVTPQGRTLHPTSVQRVEMPQWVRTMQYVSYAVVTLIIIGAIAYYNFFFEGGSASTSSTTQNRPASSANIPTPRPVDEVIPNMPDRPEIVVDGVSVEAFLDLGEEDSPSVMIENPVIDFRNAVPSGLYYSVDNPTGSGSLEIAPEQFPEPYRQGILLALPLPAISSGGSGVTYYAEPNTESERTQILSRSVSQQVYGYTVDDNGQYWFYVDFWTEDQYGYLQAEDLSEVQYMATYNQLDVLVPFYVNPTDEDPAGEIDLLRITAQIPTHYRILYPEGEESYGLRWVRKADVALPQPLIDTIATVAR